MLTNEILSTIFEFLKIDKKEEGEYAIEAAKKLFKFFKNKFKDEIYQIFIGNIELEFFEKLYFSEDEPYERGRSEAIYFVLKKFKIKYVEYSKFLKKQLLN